MSKKDDALIVFEDKNIRRTWFNDEWWFVIKDIVSVLTDSNDPSQYLKRLRQRDEYLNKEFKGGVQNVPPLGFEFETKGGSQIMQCWNTKGIFRLIQSISSKNAEPFKQWLAQVGYERIQEIEDPELAQERMKALYEAKGYSKDWIDKRLRGIAIRQNLTQEWQERGVNSQKDFAILTAEISNATFGMTPAEYKQFKNLSKKSSQNLRDHMTDLELIFTMLGEKTTSEITKERDSKGFDECKQSAKEGGQVAGNARKDAERRIGKSTISKENYLSNKKDVKRVD